MRTTTGSIADPAKCIAAAALVAACLGPQRASAAEGGITFWLPGLFGSLAATPGVPGWAWATVYIHSDVAAGAGQQFPRGGRVDVGIAGRADLVAFGPTYIFATPVLGAQASVSLLGIAGRSEASAALSLTGPLGNTIALNRTQDLTSYGDVIPQVALKWNQGVHNFMVYGTGDIPVGDYDPNRLANLGIGHGAIDFGGGYTYFNPQTGNELSAVAGLTHNFKKPAPSIRAAWTSTSTGAPPTSSPSNGRSALSATISSRSPTISVRRLRSAASARASLASAPRSATYSRSATSRAT